MRWLRGVAALGALALVLIGAPAALLAWGRLPAGWSSLTRPDDGSLLLGVLTTAGWLAWAAFAASTVAELVRLAGRSHRRLRIPLLSGMQHLSAGLLMAVLALAPSTAPAPGPASTVAAVAEPEPVPPAGHDSPPEVADDPDAGYVVQAGDDLWTVADRLLGDGGHWRDLVVANPDVLGDPTTRLAAGTRLRLPAAAANRTRHVTVRRGDTLSGLALTHLGAAGRWPRIAEANRDLIADPDHIEVGWRLVIPGAATTQRAHSGRDRDDTRSGTEGGPGHEGSGSRNPLDREPAGRPDLDVETAPAPRTAEQSSDTTGSRETSAARVGGPGEATPLDSRTQPDGTLQPDDPDPAERAPALPLLGILGSLAAAAVIGVVESRRFLRLRERPVGRRLVPPEEGAARLRAALGSEQAPDRLAVLDAALRAVGRHCHEHRRPLPELERITVGGAGITFDWASPTDLPPSGFTGGRTHWTVSLQAPPPFVDHPCPYPAVVSLGSAPGGDLVLVDAERSRVLGVSADDPELRASALAAMAVELACAPWSAEARLVVAGSDAPLVALAGGERVQVRTRVEDALAQAHLVVAQRRAALGAEAVDALRVDPDRADAVAPMVFCLLGEVGPEVAAGLDELLAGPRVGVAVLLGTEERADALWRVDGDVHAPDGRLAGSSDPFRAHAIPEPAREGVAGLLRAADDPTTTPAPWWAGTGSEPDNVLPLPQRAHRGEGDPVDIVRVVPPAAHPQVLLIGPSELRGASGPDPSRSRQQLVELCAWLLEHPGSTATAMASGLAVAEGTRRSNLSRLRAWLGDAPDGTPYLPDAYSGRVLLHPGVNSDWLRLQVLLRPGVDRVGDSTLVAALDLVRGAPLADAAPGQWHWAEELRTDVSCALRDVGIVLTDRAVSAGDIDLARWAASRALVVAPDDEQLLCARIRTEHRAGNAAEVERLVNQVSRQARLLGVDLLPETVELCQQVIEGRPRARA